MQKAEIGKKQKTKTATNETREDFETLINLSKTALERLGDPKLTLKESLEIYKMGLANLNKAQKLLEEAELEYKTLKADKQDDKEDWV